MKKVSIITVPALLAFVLSSGNVLAQTSSTYPSTSGGTHSSSSSMGAAPAADTTTSSTSKTEKLSRGDRHFLEKAAESGMFEVEAAQLAANKASDEQVKNFASTLVDQHKAANQELMDLAKNMGVELPAAPSRSMRREVEKLGKKSGADFDREFVRQVGVKDHQKDIKDFQKASKDVKNPELKAWVDKTLPTLREHLAKAEKLPEAGGKSTAAMGNR